MKPAAPSGRTPGSGTALFLVAFGLCFVAIGLYALAETRSPAPGGWDTYFTFATHLFVLVGGLLAVGGARQLWSARRLGPPKASLPEGALAPDATFSFRFAQPFRWRTEVVSVGVFLVFRERVTRERAGETDSIDEDRVIQEYAHPGRVYAPGDVLTVEHTFRIPAEEREVWNKAGRHETAAVETRWVVKVRLDLAYPADIVWREYPVTVHGTAGSADVAREASPTGLKKPDGTRH